MLVKCFTIVAHLFNKCYICLRMLVNAIAKLTNVSRMCCKCKTLVSSLHTTHYGCFSCSPGPVQLAYFPSSLDKLSTLARILRTCQYECKRIFSNVLRSLTDVLRSLQMSCHQCEWLTIAREDVANTLFLRI